MSCLTVRFPELFGCFRLFLFLCSVSRKSFSELHALGFALNIVCCSSTGSFFSSVWIKRLPYESVCTSSVSRA